MRASRSQPLAFAVLLLALTLAGSASTYTVKWGDTLGSIARHFGVSVHAIAASNRLSDPNRIRAGQVLAVPASSVQPAAQPIAAVTTPAVVRVGHGDTLGSLARRYHTSVSALASANGIAHVNRIREGAVLALPATASPVNWVCPVRGPVHYVGRFGDPRAGGRKHEGVDLAALRGTPVVANVSGVVVHHPNPLGGTAYFLHGDDGDVYYGAHLDAYVGLGGRVAMGQVIGLVGSTGDAAGGITHLHFERMPHGGPSVDPMPLLARACFGA